MTNNKFRVYFEAEFNGGVLRGIEETCSWFLLTQTGEIMVYGPLEPPHKPEKEYTKLIPLFFTGFHDKNEKELYAGDLFKDKNGNIRDIHWSDKEGGWCSKCLSDDGEHPECDDERVSSAWFVMRDCEYIGNINLDPEIAQVSS